MKGNMPGFPAERLATLPVAIFPVAVDFVQWTTIPALHKTRFVFASSYLRSSAKRGDQLIASAYAFLFSDFSPLDAAD